MLHFLLLSLIASTAGAYVAKVSKGELPPRLESLLSKASQDTKLEFNPGDFIKIEEKTLATSEYVMYVQAHAGVPVSKTAVRIWSSPDSGELILAEMHLNEKAKTQESVLLGRYKKAKFSAKALNSRTLREAIHKKVRTEIKGDKVISMDFQDRWVNGDLVRTVKARGRRGIHTLSLSLLRNAVVEKSYREFSPSDGFQTLRAHVFPIYEEVERIGTRLAPEVRELRYLEAEVPEGGERPLGELSDLILEDALFNKLLAATPQGQAQNLWSPSSLRNRIEAHAKTLPFRPNVPGNFLLRGKYATVNLHPDAKDAFGGANFPLKPSVDHVLGWVQDENGVYTAFPRSGFYGKGIASQEELLGRIPLRLPDHDPTAYLNDGSDEIQVYYGITTFMEAMNGMGFTDPGISTRPFQAFLYDPDIGMKDNAYYYDNSINFSTYSPGNQNFARDNTTIWHELGHGLMERLMGEHLDFDGTPGGVGGLSEGMADFLSLLITEHQTGSAFFPGKDGLRIMNDMGLYLSNEFHDDGEAYGGAMGEMLSEAVKLKGRPGLHAFTDLVLEGMRLTRNHPSLSPRDWFEHLLYADGLGSSVRAPREYRGIITRALLSRNFSFSPGFRPASFELSFNGAEVTSDSKGSRNDPVTACGVDGSMDVNLEVRLNGADSEIITFPAIVKVEYKAGFIQGPIRWEGEENNPSVHVIRSPGETLLLPLKAALRCETVNRPDGGCKDYAYIQVYNQGDSRPRAKKRFYLSLSNAPCP